MFVPQRACECAAGEVEVGTDGRDAGFEGFGDVLVVHVLDEAHEVLDVLAEVQQLAAGRQGAWPASVRLSRRVVRCSSRAPSQPSIAAR